MLQSRVRSTLHRAKARAKSSDRLYNLVYDVVNAAEFSDLYEHEKMLADSVRVDNPGVMDGLCLYFRVRFDEHVQFDTSPFSTNTSWTNRMLRTPLREFAAGEELSYTVDANPLYDTGMWSVTVDWHGPRSMRAAQRFLIRVTAS